MWDILLSLVHLYAAKKQVYLSFYKLDDADCWTRVRKTTLYMVSILALVLP